MISRWLVLISFIGHAGLAVAQTSATDSSAKKKSAAIGSPVSSSLPSKTVATQSVTPGAPKSTSTVRARGRTQFQPQQQQFTGHVALGMDMRGERNQDQSTLPRTWPTLSLGVGLRPWTGVLEYASFTENSGNSALNVQRKVETLLIWGQWSAEETWALEPYMAVGLGGYRSSAELALYSQKVTPQSRWIEHAAAALGFRLVNVSPILLAVEGRIHMNRELDPSPTLSGMLKLGFIIE